MQMMVDVAALERMPGTVSDQFEDTLALASLMATMLCMYRG